MQIVARCPTSRVQRQLQRYVMFHVPIKEANFYISFVMNIKIRLHISFFINGN